jgi:arylsulfatase A-like enzyme
MAFLRERDTNRPFFLFVGHVDTHSPFHSHPPRWVQRYASATFADIPKEKYTGNATRKNETPKTAKEQRERLQQYYAAVSYIDEQVGQVLDVLDGRGELDNTLVVYTGDHGHMNGHHGLYFKGNGTTPQNFYEESIRVPCLLRLPGKIPANTVRTEQVDHCDLHQTLLEAAGLPPRTDSPGMSYWTHLSTADSLWRTAQFCEYGNARMIRTNRWKLICRYAPHEAFGDELYDLQKDPREKKNVINVAANAAMVTSLREQLDAHFQRWEVAERSGKDILARPVFSPSMPWK